MRKTTRLISLVLALLMLLGTGSALAAEAGSLEHVTLEWYVAEGTKRDQEMVFAALNEYFEKTINTTVNFHFVDPTEYSSKVSTIVGSAQEVDIVNCNGQLPYVDYVKKGAFLPIEDMVKEYAPKTYELIPESFWSAMYVDGHMYGIPSYKDSCSIPGIIYNKTLLDALGIDMNQYEYGSVYDIIPVLYDIQAKRAEVFPEDKDLPVMREFPDVENYSPYETINSLAVVNIPGIEAFAGMGSGEKVFNLYATDEYRQYCHQVLTLVEDNIVPFDAWNFDPSRTYTAEGKLAIVNFGSGYITVAKDYGGNNYECALLRGKNTIASTNYLHQAVNCISVTSKNPERAMMVLELVNTDEFVATTLRFGLEGTHYNVGEDGILDFKGTSNENAADRGYYSWYGAQFGSFMHSKVPSGYPVNFTELMKEANDNAISDTNMGFIFDPKPVQNEIAACSSVIGEYEVNLKFGFIDGHDNVDAIVDEFVEKLNASGAEKIIAEAQSQLDTWRAANK